MKSKRLQIVFQSVFCLIVFASAVRRYKLQFTIFFIIIICLLHIWTQPTYIFCQVENCDMIKGNESDFGNIDCELHA